MVIIADRDRQHVVAVPIQIRRVRDAGQDLIHPSSGGGVVAWLDFDGIKLVHCDQRRHVRQSAKAEGAVQDRAVDDGRGIVHVHVDHGHRGHSSGHVLVGVHVPGGQHEGYHVVDACDRDGDRHTRLKGRGWAVALVVHLNDQVGRAEEMRGGGEGEAHQGHVDAAHVPLQVLVHRRVHSDAHGGGIPQREGPLLCPHRHVQEATVCIHIGHKQICDVQSRVLRHIGVRQNRDRRRVVDSGHGDRQGGIRRHAAANTWAGEAHVMDGERHRGSAVPVLRGRVGHP
mmetsp:Transcript_40763/g.68300  ORF Transcript_40763/g.68300 Transcript_40763/m.68300 type:complete len:285 (+) Transcript_40763:852-1706(+)